MKYRKIFTVFGILFVLFLSSCWTVKYKPSVETSHTVEESEGIYNIQILTKYVSVSGRFTVEFFDSNNCKWYQDGYTFNGTYEKINNNSYRLDMIGHSGYMSTVFIAKMEGNNLRITGGIVYGELFINSNNIIVKK